MDLQVPEIEVDALAQQREVPLIDVREVDEYEEFHVPGAVLLPLGEVSERVGEVPTEGPVFIICRSGARSFRAAEFLRTQGIDAINIAGGSLAWVDAGQAVATGPEPG